MLFARTSWTTRLIGLLLCPVAGGVLSVIHHYAGPSPLVDFASGYGFGLIACLALGAWLHLSVGHDALGRRR